METIIQHKVIAERLKTITGLQYSLFFVSHTNECVQLNLMPTDSMNSTSVQRQRYDALVYCKDKYKSYELADKIKNELTPTDLYSVILESQPQFVGRNDDAMFVCSIEFTIIYTKGAEA